jgi:hypothetical protein
MPAYTRSRLVTPALKLCNMRAAMSIFVRNMRRVLEVGERSQGTIKEAIITTMAPNVHVRIRADAAVPG